MLTNTLGSGTLLDVLGVLILIAIIYWALITLPLPDIFRTVGVVLLGVFGVLFLLNLFGIHLF